MRVDTQICRGENSLPAPLLPSASVTLQYRVLLGLTCRFDHCQPQLPAWARLPATMFLDPGYTKPPCVSFCFTAWASVKFPVLRHPLCPHPILLDVPGHPSFYTQTKMKSCPWGLAPLGRMRSPFSAPPSPGGTFPHCSAVTSLHAVSTAEPRQTRVLSQGVCFPFTAKHFPESPGQGKRACSPYAGDPQLVHWQRIHQPSRRLGHLGLTPGLGRSPGEGNGNPLQYSYLRNPTDRGAWRVIVHGDAKELEVT